MPMRRPAASPLSSSPELLLLSPAVVPPKKRRSPRGTKPAATIVPVPIPAAALPVPPCIPHQIPAPPAAAVAADADANAEFADYLMLLAHAVVSHADAEAKAASFPPAVEKLRSSSSRPPAAVDEEKHYAPLPLPPLAVKENPSSLSSMSHGHATTKASAEDCKKAAFPQLLGNAGSSSKGDQRGGGVASSAAGALASPLPQLGGDEEDLELGEIPGDDEELELGEIPPEKPATGCNADSAAHESSLGTEEMMTDGEEAKATIAGELAATGSSARRAAPAAAVSTAVVVGRDGKAAAEMSAAEQKRMREVYVGGLSRDARVEDVRAALSAAGEITEVRMIRDRATRKNKDFCFVAYRDAAMASKAIAEFNDVKICGQPCRLAVPEGNEKANKIAQRDPIIEDYNRIYEQRQAVHSSYITSYPHAWYENNTYAIPASSYVVSPVGYYIPMYRYHNGNRIYLPPPDFNHGLAGARGRSQMGQSGSSRPAGQPHRSRN